MFAMCRLYDMTVMNISDGQVIYPEESTNARSRTARSPTRVRPQPSVHSLRQLARHSLNGKLQDLRSHTGDKAGRSGLSVRPSLFALLESTDEGIQALEKNHRFVADKIGNKWYYFD